MNNVWIPGGTSGIGEKISERLSEEFHVFPTGLDVNVVDERCVKQFVDLNEEFDAMVFSAGVNILHWLKDIDRSSFDHIFRVNVFGFLNCLSAMVQRNKNPAKIICISSDASTHPMRGSTLYCSSKAALDHAVRCAARELSPDGWVINAINPGKIDDTKMTEYIDSTVPGFRKWTPEEAYEREASQIPMGRRGTKEEIANLVYSILTTDCDYMNGSIIAVNGAR